MIKDIDKFMPKITRIAVDAFANQNNLRSNKLDNPPPQKISGVNSSIEIQNLSRREEQEKKICKVETTSKTVEFSYNPNQNKIF